MHSIISLNKSLKKASFAGFFLLLILSCGTANVVPESSNEPNRMILPLMPSIDDASRVQDGIVTLGRDTIFPNIHVIGDTIEAVYYFTVNKPMIITQVWPGCQCTAPVYPTDTLRAGKIDSIVLVFYTAKVEAGPYTKYGYVLNAIREVDYFIVGDLKPASKGIVTRKYRYTNKI
jgi:hypothetical protein